MMTAAIPVSPMAPPRSTKAAAAPRESACRNSRSGARVMFAVSMIAILVNSLGPGGAEREMVNLAGALAGRGRRVMLIVVREEGPLRELVDPAVEIVDLRARRAMAGLGPLVKLLRRERPQALLSACANSNVVAVLAARLAGVGTRAVTCEQTTLSRVVLDTRRVRHRLRTPASRARAPPRAPSPPAAGGGFSACRRGGRGLPGRGRRPRTRAWATAAR